MRAPEFWNHRDGPEAAILTRTLLTPASWLYAAGAGLRAATTTPYASPAPVICVGGLSIGGAGKTPVAIAVLERLKALGVDAHALTRGYGGSKRGPLLVDPARHSARQVGDEPLLLARVAPTWVAKSKRAGARKAASAGAQAIVMDDGFQNPTVHKHISLVVIDAEAGLGNGHVFPAGPLREGPRAALKRASAVIISGNGENAPNRAAWRNYVPDSAPIIDAHVTPNAPPPAGPVFAFAGIARPQKFFDALYQAGCDLKATATFPDHHTYSRAEIASLRDTARRHNALLLTTEKDHVRLPADTARLVHTWPVRALFPDVAALDAVLERAITISSVFDR